MTERDEVTQLKAALAEIERRAAELGMHGVAQMAREYRSNPAKAAGLKNGVVLYAVALKPDFDAVVKAAAAKDDRTPEAQIEQFAILGADCARIHRGDR